MEDAIEADAMAMNSRMEFDRVHKNAHSSVEAGGKDVMLNKLFAPPEYNEEYPYGAVLEQAAEEGKWVLVNIQQAEQFESHRLNRDVWNHEAITDLVLANFLFWQRDDQSTEGAQFCKYYHDIPVLPHICVIDPRTKRSMKAWDTRKWADARTAGEFLMGFLDKFTMPRAASAAPAAASTAPASGPGQVPRVAAADTEAAALPTPVTTAAPAATVAGDAVATGMPVPAGGRPAPEVPKEAPAEMPEEPPGDVEHLKVSFRIPSGQRVARRFLPTDPLEQMFKVASALTKEPVSLVDLSTQFPKRALRDIEGGLQAVLKDAQVAGNMILVNVRSAT